MRVLFVTPYYPPAHLGGIERAIVHLATSLRDAAPDLEAVVLTTEYTFPPRFVPGLSAQERRPEAVVRRWPGRPRSALPLFPLYSCPVTGFGPLWLHRLLRELRPDVIHMVGDGWAWAHLWLLAVRPSGAAVVFTPSFHRMTPSRQWLRLPNRLLCAHAERTLVLTPQEWGDVQLVYHAPPERVRLVPWGVDLLGGRGSEGATGRGGGQDHGEQHGMTIPFGHTSLPVLVAGTPARPPASSPPKALVILCVGRLGRHKGQRWLLETYAQARPRFVRPTRLVFVGKDEDDGATLAADVASFGLAGEVRLAGQLTDTDLHEQYVQADIFALFSHYEAFGLVFFEAMAAGVPVLTHRLGAGPSLLTAGALLTAPFARDEAATALVRLVNDDALRTRLGAEGRALVERDYSWDRCARGNLDAYQEALAMVHARAGGAPVAETAG